MIVNPVLVLGILVYYYCSYKKSQKENKNYEWWHKRKQIFIDYNKKYTWNIGIIFNHWLDFTWEYLIINPESFSNG